VVLLSQMRIRNRNISNKTHNFTTGIRIGTNSYCDGTSDPPVSYSGFAVAVVSQGVNERMEDGLGKGQPHDCKHRKLTYYLNDNPYYTASVVSAPKLGVTSWNLEQARLSVYNSAVLFGDYLNWNLSDSSLPPGWFMTPTTSADEVRLKEDVIEKARGLKADVLLNLVEANQIWPSIRSLTLCLPEMAYNWNKIRKVIRTAAGGFLAWKFGVSPILSDIMSIQRWFPKIAEDVKRHAEGRPSRFASSGKVVMAFAPGDESSIVLNGHETDHRYSQGFLSESPVVRYVLVVKPRDLTGSDAFGRTLDLLMSRFTTSPASLAWEKIPFSFIADWFVDLRGVLRRIDSMLGFEPYQVVSFTRSFSYGCSAQRFWDTFSPCSGAPLFNVTVGSADYKNYERSLVSMGGSPPTWKPRFGKNQAGISAALISQYLSKVK